MSTEEETMSKDCACPALSEEGKQQPGPSHYPDCLMYRQMVHWHRKGRKERQADGRYLVIGGGFAPTCSDVIEDKACALSWAHLNEDRSWCEHVWWGEAPVCVTGQVLKH